MERARTVLEELRTIVPYEHAKIAYDDPFSGTRRLLVSVGYPDELLAHFHGPEFEASLAELHMGETGSRAACATCRATSWPCARSPSCSLPRRLPRGPTMALRTDDGRVTGLLNMSTDDDAHPTDEARDAIGILCATLGQRRRRDALGALPAAARGARLRGGGARARRHRGRAPGVAGHRLLGERSRLLRVARRLALRDRRPTRFLWPRRTAAGTGSRSRRATTTATHAPRSCPCRRGRYGIDLTRRELEVLTMVTAGWSNGEIGARLSISPRTVGHLRRADPAQAAGADARRRRGARRRGGPDRRRGGPPADSAASASGLAAPVGAAGEGLQLVTTSSTSTHSLLAWAAAGRPGRRSPTGCRPGRTT